MQRAGADVERTTQTATWAQSIRFPPHTPYRYNPKHCIQGRPDAGPTNFPLQDQDIGRISVVP